MRRTLGHVLAACVLALGVAAVVPALGAPAARALQALIAVVIWVVAATGLGGAVLRSGSWEGALALGTGLLGTVLLPVAALGLLSPWTLAGAAVLASLGWLRKPTLTLPSRDPVLWALLLPVLALGVLQALAPPIDTDEIYQHLALPRQLLRHGGLVGGLLQPDGSRPLVLHLSYTGLLALGGEAAPKGFHLVLVLALLLRVHRLGERWLSTDAARFAVLLAVGSYTLLRELGLAHNNLPTALLCVLAFEAAMDRKGWQMALFAGLALATKYLAAPVVVGVFLVWLARTRDVKGAAIWSVAALALVAPWWIRNAAEGLHPLFPYAGWPDGGQFEFAYIERYGMGRGWQDFLLLPWNATVHARTDNYQFLGRITPAALATLPAVIWVVIKGSWEQRALIGAAVVCCIGWAIGPHWLRYLLPASPILVLAAASGFHVLPRWGRVGLVGVWLAGLPANWGPVLREVAPTVPVTLTGEGRQALLQERVPGYDAVRFASDELPDDAHVALLFAWPGYYLDRSYVVGSVEDHVPTRHLIHREGDQTLDALRALGVTHVVAGRVRFIHKAYPFLDEQTFDAQFVQSEAQLEAQLLAQGTLVFESGRYGVWRLVDP